jgi:ribonuclease HI
MDEELTEVIISNKTEDPKLWLFWLFDILPSNDLARVLISMWAIWWARRRAIHDQQFQSPLSTFTFINKYIGDVQAAHKCVSKISREMHVTGQTQAAGWLPPPADEMKINVDGALSRDGRRGAVAAICRDKNGIYIGASVVIYEGLVDPPSLEAQACNEALSLAQDLLQPSVYVVSDCLEAINNINSRTACHYAAVLRDIDLRRGSFNNISFGHEHRQNNAEAHALAKASTTLAFGRHVWLVSLPEIICIPMNVVIN